MLKIVLVVAAMGGSGSAEYVVDGNVFIDPLRRCEAIAEAIKGQSGSFGVTAHCVAKEINTVIAARSGIY